MAAAPGVPIHSRWVPGIAMEPGPTTITPYRNGPYLVRGPLVLTDQDGNEIELRRKVVALCRCGRSQIRPFCDGTHKAIRFRAESGPPSVDPAGSDSAK